MTTPTMTATEAKAAGLTAIWGGDRGSSNMEHVNNVLADMARGNIQTALVKAEQGWIVYRSLKGMATTKGQEK